MKVNSFIKVLFLLCLIFQSSYASSKILNVTLVSPSTDEDKFWGMAHSFARASAKDLNIQLEIKRPAASLDRFDYLETLKEVFEREKKPDFVIVKLYDKITIDILSLSEANNVPIFIINSNIAKADKKSVGRLRRNFDTFIGHMAPNEQKVGYDLAKYLIGEIRKTNENGRLKVAAITTNKRDTKSKERIEGLEKAVKEEFRVKLYKVEDSSNTKEEAYIQANRLINKYYDLNVIWTTSDTLALGSKIAIDDNSLSHQTITGGINWTSAGISAVKNKKISATIGGHFMDAGFTLVLLHDLFNNKDFFEQFNTKIDSNMFLITADNVDKYLKVFGSHDWDKLDFKKYSKVYNQNLKEYNFSLETLFNNLE